MRAYQSGSSDRTHANAATATTTTSSSGAARRLIRPCNTVLQGWGWWHEPLEKGRRAASFVACNTMLQGPDDGADECIELGESAVVDVGEVGPGGFVLLRQEASLALVQPRQLFALRAQVVRRRDRDD